MLEATEINSSKKSHLAQIIFFNLIPLIGVLVMKWDAKLLILAYFIETIIAILFHSVRLWYVNFRWGNNAETISRASQWNNGSGGNNIPSSCLPIFILVFFGFFCFVQLFVLGGFAQKAFPDDIFYSMYEAGTGELLWAIASFVFLQLSRFVREVIQDQYKNIPAQSLMFQPFRRILVQHLTVILGAFFILLGGPATYVFVLVLVNFGIDFFFFSINSPKLKKLITKNDPVAEQQFEDMKRIM